MKNAIYLIWWEIHVNGRQNILFALTVIMLTLVLVEEVIISIPATSRVFVTDTMRRIATMSVHSEFYFICNLKTKRGHRHREQKNKTVTKCQNLTV